MVAATVVCPGTKLTSRLAAEGVFRMGLFQFRSAPAGVVKLVYRDYDAVVSLRRRFPRRDQSDLLQVVSLLGVATGKDGSE
jgi:hypothetical protein